MKSYSGFDLVPTRSRFHYFFNACVRISYLLISNFLTSLPDVTCIFCYQNVVFSLVFVDFLLVSFAYPVNQYSYLSLICIEYVDCGLGAISCVDLSVDRSNAFLWHFSMADRSSFGNDILSLEIYVSLGYPLGSLTYVVCLLYTSDAADE